MSETKTTIEYLFDDETEGQFTETEAANEATAAMLYRDGSYIGAVKRNFPGAFLPGSKRTADELQELNLLLSERIKTGDETAKEELVVANMPMLFRITSKRCRQFDLPAEDFEEVLQDAAVQLVQLAKKYEAGTARFSTYAWKSVDLAALSNCKGRAHDEASLDATVGEEDDVTFGELIPDESAGAAFEKADMMMSVLSELERLPRLPRLVFSMAYGLNGFNEMTVTEIAEETKLSRQMVYNYLDKVRMYLRMRLNPDEETASKEETKRGVAA